MKLLARPFLLNLCLLLLAIILSIAIGAVTIPPAILARMLLVKTLGIPSALTWPSAFEVIAFQIRLPHTALVLLTGAALGGSGAAYQGLFRNPLADPYLIGVASGAGLGAVLAMTLREMTQQTSLLGVPAAAFLGALVTVGTVFFLATRGRKASMATLILAGVAVSAFTSALTSYLMLRSQGELYRALAWLLGGSTLSGWQPVWSAFPYIVIGLGALLTSGHALNVLQYGEEQAVQLGLPVQRAQILIVLAASLATGAAISFSGIIGFIGLITPHLARILWGADYRRLIPLSILGGATALLLADLLARVILAPQELPVGIITALVGAPFFVWVLRRTTSPQSQSE